MEDPISILRQHQRLKLDHRLQLNEKPQRDTSNSQTVQETPPSNTQIKHNDESLEAAAEKAQKIGSPLQRRPNPFQPEPFNQQLELIQHCRTSIQKEASLGNFHQNTSKINYSRQEAYKAMLGMHRKLSTVDERGLGFDRRYELHLQYQQAKLLMSALKEIQEHTECKTKNCQHRYRGRRSDSTTGDAGSLGETDEMDSKGEEWFNSPEEALRAIERCWAVIEGLGTEKNDEKGEQNAKELRQPRFQKPPPVQGWNMRINSEWAEIENGMAVSCDGDTATARRERRKEMKSYRPLNNIRTFLEKSSADSNINTAERSSKSRQERRGEQFDTQPMQFIWSVDGCQRGTYGIEAMRMLSEKARKEGRICSWIMY